MKPPDFWQSGRGTLLPHLLSPLSSVVASVTARRVAKPGWRAPVPVICVGNVTVGGAGKTTVALDLGRRLREKRVRLHFLTRGYGGSVKGVRCVQPGDPPTLVGDEALLLAELAPTWVAADRAASARAAVAAGAQLLVMEDGLQNPTLAKDLSLLVVDGPTGFGNGFVLPAGPLREPLKTAASRCQAAVIIGPDQAGVAAALPPGLPIIRAGLAPAAEIADLRGRRVLAATGIARPEKFFHMLEEHGVSVAVRAAFPDHHQFTTHELDGLRNQATREDLILVITPKDAARLNPQDRKDFRVIGVSLLWQDAAAIDRLLSPSALKMRSADRSPTSQR